MPGLKFFRLVLVRPFMFFATVELKKFNWCWFWIDAKLAAAAPNGLIMLGDARAPMPDLLLSTAINVLLASIIKLFFSFC